MPAKVGNHATRISFPLRVCYFNIYLIIFAIIVVSSIAVYCLMFCICLSGSLFQLYSERGARVFLRYLCKDKNQNEGLCPTTLFHSFFIVLLYLYTLKKKMKMKKKVFLSLIQLLFH